MVLRSLDSVFRTYMLKYIFFSFFFKKNWPAAYGAQKSWLCVPYLYLKIFSLKYFHNKNMKKKDLQPFFFMKNKDRSLWCSGALAPCLDTFAIISLIVHAVKCACSDCHKWKNEINFDMWLFFYFFYFFTWLCTR